MKSVLQPWHLLLFIIAGWVNRHQQDVLEYLRTENQVLKEKLGKKRILLSDDQRRRLAVKGKVLGRKALEEIGTIVTPDTLLRWHRELVARKWDYSRQRQKAGRPLLSKEIIELVLRMAGENSTWGYDRIQGALANLGHKISDSAVANILRQHGIEPAPERKRQTTWHAFLKAHWDVLASVDFTTMEVWTKKGLVTYYLLFFMELATRRIYFAGLTVQPDEGWLLQVARNVTDAEGGFLRRKRYLLMDRDAKFSEGFRRTLEAVGVKPVRLPARSPNLNSHIERFMRSVKEECLERMIFFGERSLQAAVCSYMEHYHTERNHQGIGNQLLLPSEGVGRRSGDIACRERLGGLLRYYYREAA